MRHIFISAIPKFWETIRYSYWLIPSVMALGALGLAFGLLEVDRAEAGGLISELGWVYAGGSDGAREVLSVISGSMITVAGVVFSITMVALTLASSQFGPRVLRNFMQDRGNQFVLGTFISTLVFSLMVLRTIEGGDESFIPQLSVTTSVAMALGSLGVLIYFIHHVALSIQASQVVATIGRELFASIDRTYPEKKNRTDSAAAPSAREFVEDGASEIPEGGARQTPDGGAREIRKDVGAGAHGTLEKNELDAHPLPAKSSGYLQAIDMEALVGTAREADVVLQLLCRPGDFISQYKPLLLCIPASRWDDHLHNELLDAFTAGKERSHTQDVLFAVDQLVEVAIRALSPSINDPFTAIRCLDWLGAGLSRALTRGPASSYHEDDEGNLRLVSKSVTFAEMVDAAFQQIQEFGSRSAAVTIHVLEVICDVSRHARTDAQRGVLLRHARQVLQNGQRELSQDQDRDRVKVLYAEVLRGLKSNEGRMLEEGPESGTG